jgi:type I restriction enzyme, S subunit
MTDIPTGWETATLGELADFVMGQAPPGSETNFDGVGIPFVKAGEFATDRPLIREWTTRPLKLARDTDVLICVVGATSGKINLGAECAIGRSVAAIRPTEALRQQYIYDFLKTKVDELRQGATGSAQGVISREMLSRIEIPLAPLAEQRRIIAKLDSLTGATARAYAELEHIPALIARYKQAILSGAFDGELTRVWRAEHGVDKDPPVVRLEDVAKDLSYGSSAKSSKQGKVPVLRMGNIQSGALDWEDLVYTSDPAEINKYLLTSGDVLFNRTNSPELVGKTAVFRGERKAIFAGYLIRGNCSPLITVERG